MLSNVMCYECGGLKPADEPGFQIKVWLKQRRPRFLTNEIRSVGGRFRSKRSLSLGTRRKFQLLQRAFCSKILPANRKRFINGPQHRHKVADHNYNNESMKTNTK